MNKESAPTVPPVRLVHLGLGAFHRAHQAWYTEQVNQLDGTEPAGIWAFTGRRPDAAISLQGQGYRYTLITRAAGGDSATTINSIVRASDGADREAWHTAMTDPQVAVVTLTITEKGYLAAEGEGDRIAAGAAGESAIGRLVDGLRARRSAGAGPLAIVSCDNLADNGAATKRAVTNLAGAVDPELAGWVDDNISFVSTMVDRITPATTAEDIATAADLAGWPDQQPVVTEPFTEWVLAGDFPAGRPAWERAGARFVDDIAPYEKRKLWLLNGGHSLLAYVGLGRGHETVAEAMGDPYCVDLLEELWAEARPCLPFGADELDEATQALRDRFTNPRIRHLLKQIAADGSLKLPLRIINVHQARKAAGLSVGIAAATVLAAWITHLGTDLVTDPSAEQIRQALASETDKRGRAKILVQHLAPDLAVDTALIDAIAKSAH